MSGLHTKVEGDVGAVAAAADSLGSVAETIGGVGSAFATASAVSEGVWTGVAAEAFRAGLQPVRTATDEVADAARRASQAMHTFSGELRAVKAMVDQATSIASAAGL